MHMAAHMTETQHAMTQYSEYATACATSMQQARATSMQQARKPHAAKMQEAPIKYTTANTAMCGLVNTL